MCVSFLRWTTGRLVFRHSLMHIKDPNDALQEEWASYHRHHYQVTNSCPNFCWEGNGKPPSITLAQEAASATQTLINEDGKSNIKPDSAHEQNFHVLWRHSLFLLIQVSFRSRGPIFVPSVVYSLILLCTQELYAYPVLSYPQWCIWVCLKCKSLFVIFCFVGASRFTWHWFTNILRKHKSGHVINLASDKRTIHSAPPHSEIISTPVHLILIHPVHLIGKSQ